MKRNPPGKMTRCDPVCQCIYCGNTDPTPLNRFTDEHILPFGLGGTSILPQSSCDKCQKIINHEIEEPLIRNSWGNFREQYGLDTRGRTLRKYVKAKSVFGEELRIPIADYPAIMPVYQFGTARLISNEKKVQNREILIKSNADIDEQRCRELHPTWDGTHGFVVRIDRFARLLAKIAYCWTVANTGTGWFRETITPIILGTEKDHTLHVGGDMNGFSFPDETAEHPMFMFETRENGIGIVLLHLKFIFGDSRSCYHVILGECDFKINTEGQVILSSEIHPDGHVKILRNHLTSSAPAL